MPAVNRMRLHALADREFKRESKSPTRSPAPARFRGIKVSLAKYDTAWDRKRGTAARLMAVLVRESDDELTERVCEDAQSARTYRGASDWLTGEARYLRKLATMMDTAAGRLSVVLQRCGHPAPPAGQGPVGQADSSDQQSLS